LQIIPDIWKRKYNTGTRAKAGIANVIPI
jgi:hypothetical protein